VHRPDRARGLRLGPNDTAGTDSPAVNGDDTETTVATGGDTEVTDESNTVAMITDGDEYYFDPIGLARSSPVRASRGTTRQATTRDGLCGRKSPGGKSDGFPMTPKGGTAKRSPSRGDVFAHV